MPPEGTWVQMSSTVTRLTQVRAPCGMVVAGEEERSEDGQGLVSSEVRYACGCRSYREEYHDGSVEHRTVRHDHRVILDGHDGEHLA